MDANRALEYLNKFILHGKEVWLVCKEAVLITCLKIKLSWTPGKGMMGKQWKDCWDYNHGCSYIPVNKLDLQVVKNKGVLYNRLKDFLQHNIMKLEEGGKFDEETMPDWLRPLQGAAHREYISPLDQLYPPQSEEGFESWQQPPGARMQGVGPNPGELVASSGYLGGQCQGQGHYGQCQGQGHNGQCQGQGHYGQCQGQGHNNRGAVDIQMDYRFDKPWGEVHRYGRPRGKDNRFGKLRDRSHRFGITRCLIKSCENATHSTSKCLCLYHIRNPPKRNMKLGNVEVAPTFFRKPTSLKTEFDVATATASSIMSCPMSSFNLGHQGQQRMKKYQQQSADHNKINLGRLPFLSITSKT